MTNTVWYDFYVEPKRNKIKDSDTENNLMVARREGSGGLGEKSEGE